MAYLGGDPGRGGGAPPGMTPWPGPPPQPGQPAVVYTALHQGAYQPGVAQVVYWAPSRGSFSGWHPRASGSVPAGAGGCATGGRAVRRCSGQGGRAEAVRDGERAGATRCGGGGLEEGARPPWATGVRRGREEGDDPREQLPPQRRRQQPLPQRCELTSPSSFPSQP